MIEVFVAKPPKFLKKSRKTLDKWDFNGIIKMVSNFIGSECNQIGIAVNNIGGVKI